LTSNKKIIIRYRDGQSPDELAQKVRGRLERGESLIGQAANLSEDLISTVRHRDPPELALKSLRETERDAGVVSKRSLVSISTVLGSDSQKTKGHPLGEIYFAQLAPGYSVEEAVRILNQDPRVKYAEAGRSYRAFIEPNDSGFDQQWGLAKIRAPEAWETTTGSKEVTVAVLDTGVDYNHEDLAANTISDCPDICDTVNQDQDPLDDEGHGTYVAGIIGALTDNEIGVAGVNWQVTLMPVKGLDNQGQGVDSTILPGIRYAVDQGADVINMSFGNDPDKGGACPQSWQEVINYAVNEGVLLVASAGNESDDAGKVSPANCGGVLTVGGTDAADRRWISGADSGSNYGSVVDISAPATDILSTHRDNQYATGTGTSASAPFVSGAAALLLAQDPSRSSAEIKNVLLSTAAPILSADAEDHPIGPRLDVAAALGGGEENSSSSSESSSSNSSSSEGPPPTGGPGPVDSVTLSLRLQGVETKAPDRDIFIDLVPDQIILGRREIHQTVRFIANDQGIFSGTLDLSNDEVNSGAFALRVNTSAHLRRRFLVGLNAGRTTLNLTGDDDVLLAGDLNDNGSVDLTDKDILVSSYDAFFGLVPSAADLDENGYINSLDYSILVNNLGCRDEDPPDCPTSSSSESSSQSSSESSSSSSTSSESSSSESSSSSSSSSSESESSSSSSSESSSSSSTSSESSESSSSSRHRSSSSSTSTSSSSSSSSSDSGLPNCVTYDDKYADTCIWETCRACAIKANDGEGGCLTKTVYVPQRCETYTCCCPDYDQCDNG
jgi:thermitase